MTRVDVSSLPLEKVVDVAESETQDGQLHIGRQPALKKFGQVENRNDAPGGYDKIISQE